MFLIVVKKLVKILLKIEKGSIIFGKQPPLSRCI